MSASSEGFDAEEMVPTASADFLVGRSSLAKTNPETPRRQAGGVFLFYGVKCHAKPAYPPALRGLPVVRPLLPECRPIGDALGFKAYACMFFGFVQRKARLRLCCCGDSDGG
jgi:hypothetical protein